MSELIVRSEALSSRRKAARLESEVGLLDPLSDRRWAEFVDRQAGASVFHTVAWLEALRRTYGYEPFVVTTCKGELANGLVACHVRSRITGNRIVSVPFADHCEPLGEDSESTRCLLVKLAEIQASWACKYLEIRPHTYRPEIDSPFTETARYHHHVLDIRGKLEEIAVPFHPSCVLRKIRRAEREKLSWDADSSARQISAFYAMQVLTRRRHKVPPQPLAWFQNLADCFGKRLKIWLAYRNGRPVAGILTLAHGKTLVYKYACSDARLHNLGGPVFLFWKVIQEAHAEEYEQIDMGRSDMDQPSLVEFKEHWGAKGSTLSYWRLPKTACQVSVIPGRRLAGWIIGHSPSWLLKSAGSVVYRHCG